MKAVTLILISLTTLLVSCAAREEQDPIKSIESDLSAANEVQFFFVRMSDEPKLSVAEIKGVAGVRIVRRCGANCLNYMAPVLKHLKAARPMPCVNKGQNVLIVVKGAPPIIYSQGGHRINVGGECFFSMDSVNSILERREFIFL